MAPRLRRHEVIHIAELLREQRERLESAREELDSKGDANSVPEHPVGRHIFAVEGRLLDMQSALLKDLERRRVWRGTALAERRRRLTAPRLGILRHHSPKPLLVPAKYFATRPPQPAPTISIVTPSFRQGRFLERTLYSVLSQAYPQLEYVVQDGGSDDGSVEILRSYESQLDHWVSEPDDGQADAINRGFAHTSGEIMAYLNSDDMLLPGALSYVANYFAAHPDVDAVYGHRVMVDEDDRQIGVWVLPRHDDDELTLLDFVPQETLFWRRSTWERAGGQVDAGLRFALDWDLLLRMRDSGARIVRLPRYLGAFRVHEEQKTLSWLEVCEQECDMLRRRVHGRHVSHEEAVQRAMHYMRRHVAYHLAHRLRDRLPRRRSEVHTLPPQAVRGLPSHDARTLAKPAG